MLFSIHPRRIYSRISRDLATDSISLANMTCVTSTMSGNMEKRVSLFRILPRHVVCARSTGKSRLGACIRWKRWRDWQAGSTRRGVPWNERDTPRRYMRRVRTRVCFLSPENARLFVVTDSPILYPPPRTRALNDSDNSSIGVADTREPAHFEPTSVPNKGRNFGWRALSVTTLQGRNCWYVEITQKVRDSCSLSSDFFFPKEEKNRQ